MQILRARFALFVSAALISAALPMSQSLAAPAVMERDRSDNLTSFDYDSETGEKASDSTWTRDGGSADVLFRVTVIETEDSGSGLLGKLTMRLDGDKAVRYDGWLALRLVDESGEVTFHRAQPSEIILRPQPGLRRAIVRFRVDVPTGTYTASGSFEA